MKRTLTLLSLASATLLAQAQCDDLAIPFTAIQVSTSGTTGVSAATVWVCGSLDVTLIGDLMDVYIEESSYVQIVGSFNTIHAKGGSMLAIQGDSSLVFHIPTTMVTITGQAVLDIPCGAMAFDYTNAPTPLCPGIASGVADDLELPRLELGPNPTDGQLRVRTDRGVLRSVSALDLTGRTVLHVDVIGDGLLDVSALATGEYLLRANTDQGMVTGRFSKR